LIDPVSTAHKLMRAPPASRLTARPSSLQDQCGFLLGTEPVAWTQHWIV